MASVNIGILAHIDAGKTSLTERILFDNGVIDALGRVDDGTTQTDTDAIERRRGITIRTAVAAFARDGRQVNLIDTPGHSEFIAEVERALTVLDGAVLVMSAVEGVQAQTRVIMKTLQQLGMPTLIFVNKIDRSGARGGDLLADIRRRLSPRIVPMNTPHGLGTPGVGVTDAWTDLSAVAEQLADHDDDLLAALVGGAQPDRAELTARLAALTASGSAFPVFFGSARGGQGVADLLDGVRDLLPGAAGGEDAEPRGTVFALERDARGTKTAYVRLFDGTVRARERVTCHRLEADGTITGYTGQISSLQVVGPEPGEDLTAGHIGLIKGLPPIRVGDWIGTPDKRAESSYFARPSLESLVRAGKPEHTNRLHDGLLQLAERDPLISTRAVAGGRTSVMLYGEIQKEIIAETLARDFGVQAVFEASQTVHLERPDGSGSAVIAMGRSPFVAGVGLRVEAGAEGSGFTYRRETELGALPRAFHLAIEETARQTLTQGLYGWSVTDCLVTLIHTEFDNACSTGGDFRRLTPLVVMRALARARTRVFEPCHAFEVEVPQDLLNTVTMRLVALEARIHEMSQGDRSWLIGGSIPAREVHGFTAQLSELTSGEGVWWSRVRGDRPITGRAPKRGRTDGNPLNTKEYLFHLSKRVR
jgi:ribosomal protection tetracycline resistance protein